MKFLVRIYEFLCSTYDIRVFGEFFKDIPTIFFFWHSKFFVLPYVFRNRPVKVLVSPSRDGDVISEFLLHFGIYTIRSSQRKNRFHGIYEVENNLLKGYSIAITPDGPIGPARKFKAGTISLLKRVNARCVFVGVEYTSFWKLDSWDEFEVPMPFTKVSIYALEGCPKDEEEAEGRLNLACSIARSLL